MFDAEDKLVNLFDQCDIILLQEHQHSDQKGHQHLLELL